MRYEVLGPLRIVGDDTWSIGAPKVEALFALLLFKADQQVTSSQLMDELWGEKPPQTALACVQSYISLLRKQFRRHGGSADTIVTHMSGYILRLGDDEFDVRSFLAEVGRGRVYLRDRRYHEAAECLTGALSIWRGPVLGDIRSGPFIRNCVTWLTETKIEGTEMLTEAQLQLGQHREMLGRLYALIAEHPLREVFYRQLMLALYRSGCRAESLKVYHQARVRLREELGLEPGRELRGLQQQILNSDYRLDLAALPTAA